MSLDYVKYHDEEWGRPVHDDRLLFELLTLEGAQAGLSWLTVLRKREAYRRAFDGFNPSLVSRYDSSKVAWLMSGEAGGIVRHRGKVESAVGNARGVLQLIQEFGSFDAYVWRYVDNMPCNIHSKSNPLPTQSPQSVAMSKDLMKRGFKFVGPTIMYSFMQAAGLVNDHMEGCFCRDGMER